MFLDLQLWITSVPITFLPKLTVSYSGVTSIPNSLSSPLSSNVLFSSNLVLTVSVVILLINGRLDLLNFSSLTSTVLSTLKRSLLRTSSLPLHVTSWEFQKLDAIPPFSRSSNPYISAIASQAEVSSKTAGVPKGISSTQ